MAEPTPASPRAAGRATGRFRPSQVVEVAVLAWLAYVPFLASSPGRVVADTKQYLYLDPGRFLSRALWLWDPHVAAGTVPHQQIGYLFPMGPYFWLMDTVGVPDWVAQRIWLGTISLLAVLGARWLFRMLGVRRTGALAGALVYMLTPYQLAFTARISVLLLAWAGLPWLVGLTMRAVRNGGWRDPAIFALVVLSVGSVNAATLLLALVAPGLWLLLQCFDREVGIGRAWAAAWRIGLLSTGVSIWWAVGLRLQGAYGLPVLQLTENLHVVSLRSTPLDLLRGLGNWFFYGGDRLGVSVGQSTDYAHGKLVVLCSFAIPVVAILAVAFLRWRHRAYFLLLVVVGVIVGVGAWPYDDPSAYGRLWKSFANGSSIGLALRNTPRIGPVIVLGLAALIAAGVGAIPERTRSGASRTWVSWAALGVVAALAFGALAPVWKDGYLFDRLERPEDVPDYWKQAAAALDAQGDATRVFEIPGANFSAYRWGNTVEPITPGLTDRPYLAREVLPYGSPQTVNLLDAIDRRMQEGTFEASSLAPVSRLFGVGTVALRSDLQYERFGLVQPQVLWKDLTNPLAPGFDAPKTFGPLAVNGGAIDPTTVATLTDPRPPAVALFDVQDAVPIVHTAPSKEPVVLAGDGDGIVDAAAAGLIDGNQLVLERSSLTSKQYAQSLAAQAALILTDSNRRRGASWFASLSHNKGATEQAGETLPDPYLESFPLDVFPLATDADRTVVEQRGARVTATADGGTNLPEQRAARAFDGDPRTSWRVGGADPTGASITVRPDTPVRTDHVTLLQAPAAERAIAVASVSVNGGTPVLVPLGADSVTGAGQTVTFPETDVRELTVTITAMSDSTVDPEFAGPVGFAEIGLEGVQVEETVRLPLVLTHSDGHSLDVVLSRLRTDPADRAHQDEELAIDRRFVVGNARGYGVSGTVRVNPNAPDQVIDSVLGTTAPGVTYSSSSHLQGDADARASRAFDGDPATAWTSATGNPVGQAVQVTGVATTVDHLALDVVADGRHSVPTQLTVTNEAGDARTVDLPAIADGAIGSSTHVDVPFPSLTASRQLTVTVTAARAVGPGGATSTRSTRCPSHSPRSRSPACRYPRRRPPCRPSAASTSCASTATRSRCAWSGPVPTPAPASPSSRARARSTSARAATPSPRRRASTSASTSTGWCCRPTPGTPPPPLRPAAHRSTPRAPMSARCRSRRRAAT
ncbi:MAG: alpha-(1-_3)-arabinofuranosyltransferase family protein [Acidimicrobiia bacterium]